MTTKARQSFSRKLAILVAAALLCFVLALQLVSAPVLEVASKTPVSAYSYGNGVNISYNKAESGYAGEDYTLSDSSVESQAAMERTPAPSDEVTVIVTVGGTPMMQFATAKNMSVAEAMATKEGMDNLEKLNAKRSLAKESVSKYIIDYGFEYSTITNAFSATVKYGDVNAIRDNKNVESVILSNTYLAPQTITENYVDVYETGIFNSSGVGYDGTGTVIAVADTGTDYTHEVFDMELDADTLALTKDDVAALVPVLAATALSAARGEVINEDDLYLKSKLPFAYDYADADDNVYPREAHGTHVAGIIAGESDTITGVAPRAQIVTLKVFSDYGSGAKTEWILAGLNDAVTLGVDAINMSLGSSCGFSREVDEEEINKIYDSINDAGICLVVAAGNEYSSAQGSTWGNTNLATNPDSGTVGSPGSYTASLSVGSVSGVKTKYFMVDDHEIYFAESRITGKTDPNNFVDELLGDKSEGEYEYVVVPSIGLSVNYTGIDVTGKIAVVKRGDNSFEEKIKIAMDKGAIAVVCYNNKSGSVNMSIGTKPLIPSCFISMDLAEPIVASGTGIIKVSKEYLAGPFMSDFSCWGVLPDMTLVPDITAHGGEIYSSVPGGDQYQKMNGTSMACPNLAGALILVRQYVKEHNPEYTAPETRDESYSRMMSTGTIVRNEYGNPYSPRKQGAGIADISHSINTKAYLTVDGSNKPKLSLGDDPARTGEYTMKFNIVNTSNTAISYNMGAYVMTESMSIDERTVAERAYMFDDTAKTYSITAKKGKAAKNGNSITVSGYGEAEITVTIKLSASDKKYLNDTFRNGMFVEGYILLDSNNLDGIDLNIPFLAFYGDWTDAPMLDVTAYEVGESNVDESVKAEEKLQPDIYGSLPLAGFASASAAEGIGYTGIGSFAYILAEGYTAPETQEKFAALTTNPDGDYLLYGIAAGLFRGAKRVEWDIRNSATGELVKNGTTYNARKSHSSGGEQSGGFVKIELDMRTLDLPNNSKYTFSMSCYLDWKDENGEYTYGNKNTFSFEFTVDNEAPVLNDVAVRKDGSDYYLELTMFDNHYLQCYSVYTYEGIDANNNITGVTTLAKGGVIPANGEFNRDNTLKLDISQYWSQIQANGGKLYLTAYDYAKNMSTYEIVIEEETDLQISKKRAARDEYTVVPNGQIELSDYITVRANALDDVDEDGKSYLEDYWTKDLIWESSDPDSVEVDRNTGLVTGIKEGSAVITVRTPNVAEFREDDLLHCLSFTIKVEGEPTEIALSGIEMYVYKVDANGDLITDDNGDPIEVQSSTLSLERGEYAVIGAKTKPYNFTGDVTLEWTSTSSNVRIEKVAEDGMSAKIFAAKSGSATIRATVSGSRISGYTSVRVLNEFIVESVYLRSYTGRGGDWVNEDGEVEHNVVEIPDDLGIVYIYPRAFQGNQYIKKVIIPEGVMIVMKYAFTNCPSLEEVVLPSSVETLEEYAFYQLIEWDDNSDEPTYLGHLTKINLENVKSIGRLAFHGCKMEEVDLAKCTYVDSTAFMYCTELKSVDLSRVGTVGGGAFAFCTSLTSLIIPENTTLNSYAPALVRGYLGAFYGCTGLETVEIRSKSVGDMAFAYCENLTTVTFTGDMDFIGDQAFLYCTALTDVNFNGTLYSIGDMAFFGCENLPSITLPAGLTQIGAAAFGNDRALTTVRISSGALLETLDPTSHTYFTSVQKFIVEEGNKYLASDDYGILYDRAYKKIIAFPFNAPYSGMTLPDSVVTVGKGAFSGAWYLQNVNLNNVEYIESYAFADMIQLTSVTGTKVKHIGDYAFYATDITSLPISDNTTYIGDYAFAGCDALTSTAFNAPAKLSYLGDYAFAGIEYTAYDGTQETRIVPLTTVTFSNDVNSLGEGIFQNCTDLSEVDLTGLTRLSANMFVGCTALTSINVPSSVKSIGEGVFEGCSELSSVTLSDKLTSIPARAFYNTALSAITVPQGVTSIGTRAFAGTDLTSIELANTDSESKRTVSIGSYAFSETKLTSVGSSIVNSVGRRAFYRCTDLATVNLAGATSVGEGAFEGCAALSSVTLTAAKEIGDRAFADCTSLTSITLANAEYVGGSAFSGAAKLATVNLPKVKEMGSEVLSGTAVTVVKLPASLQKVADGVFNGAEKLEKIEVDEDNKSFITHKDKGVDKGVLYSVTDNNYYVLIAYPAGKTDETEYSVLDRTIKLAANSFCGNDTLTKLTLPVYLQVIGISAMSGMSKLNEIVINATEAPTLESRSWVEYERDESGEIATDNWGSPLYTFMNQYDNFNFVFDPTDETEHNLKITVPANNNGYFNSRIWKLYVGKYIEVSDKAHATLATLNFIERVKALPTNPTAADAEEIAALLRIYNMFNTVQSYIVLGRYGDYNDNGVTIDADYYEALLQGKNYYSILTAAQNSLPAAVVSAMNAELYGTSATVTTDTMRNVVIALFGIALIVAVAVFASKFNKRRGLK